MANELAPVDTNRNGRVTLTQFWGGEVNKTCVQLTVRTVDCTGQKDPVQLMQLTKDDARALAWALLEVAEGEREPA